MMAKTNRDDLDWSFLTGADNVKKLANSLASIISMIQIVVNLGIILLVFIFLRME